MIEASTVPTSLLGSDFFLSFETDPLENPSDSSTLVHRTSFSSSSSSPRLGPLFRDERLSVAVAVPRHSPPPEPPSPRRERAASIPSVSSSQQHPDSSFPLLPLLLPGWGSSSPPPCRLYPRRPRRLERERERLALSRRGARGLLLLLLRRRRRRRKRRRPLARFFLQNESS